MLRLGLLDSPEHTNDRTALEKLRRPQPDIAAVVRTDDTLSVQSSQVERRSGVLAHLLVSQRIRGYSLLVPHILRSEVSGSRSSDVAAHCQRTHRDILE